MARDATVSSQLLHHCPALSLVDLRWQWWTSGVCVSSLIVILVVLMVVGWGVVGCVAWWQWLWLGRRWPSWVLLVVVANLAVNKHLVVERYIKR